MWVELLERACRFHRDKFVTGTAIGESLSPPQARISWQVFMVAPTMMSVVTFSVGGFHYSISVAIPAQGASITRFASV